MQFKMEVEMTDGEAEEYLEDEIEWQYDGFAFLRPVFVH